MNLDDATADRLRELGATEDMLQWLREPEAVRKLLARTHCECERLIFESHDQDCEVAQAWHKMGHAEAKADVLNAWDEALLYSEDDIRRLRERNAWDARMRRGREGVAAIRETASLAARMGLDQWP